MARILEDHLYYAKSETPDPRVFDAILTRFNARTNFGSGADQAWIDKRTEIFSEICLPSIISQRKKPHAWLLLLDGENRGAVSRLLDVISPYHWIIPVWQEAVSGRHEKATTAFERTIRGLLPVDAEYIRTTRIDNDDALSRYYLEFAGKYSRFVFETRFGGDFWLVFPFGVQYASNEFRCYMHSSPHFVTRCVRRDTYLSSINPTVLSTNHGHVVRLENSFSPLTDQPVWLQYVHGDNVVNGIKLNNHPMADHSTIRSWFAMK